MKHKIEHAHTLSDELKLRLTDVWEQSVRATHGFVSDTDISALLPIVFDSLDKMESIVCINNAEGIPSAFLAMVANKIEMLFVHPYFRHMGQGKALILYAIDNLGAKYVDVNEQNPQALIFYECMGFITFRRSETDAQGNAFPILHMEKV